MLDAVVHVVAPLQVLAVVLPCNCKCLVLYGNLLAPVAYSEESAVSQSIATYAAPAKAAYSVAAAAVVAAACAAVSSIPGRRLAPLSNQCNGIHDIGIQLVLIPKLLFAISGGRG